MKEIDNIEILYECLICQHKTKLNQVNEFHLCQYCFIHQKKEQIFIEKKREKFFPEINQISDKVYLGNYDGQKEKEKLKLSGITHILACGANLKDSNNGEFTYLQLDLYDFYNENLFRVLKIALNFIDISKKVYVHCHAGISRSAAIVIAFFMWKDKMKFKEAISFVRSKRSCIFPNGGFYEQLKSFEKLLIDYKNQLDFLDN